MGFMHVFPLSAIHRRSDVNISANDRNWYYTRQTLSRLIHDIIQYYDGAAYRETSHVLMHTLEAYDNRKVITANVL